MFLHMYQIMTTIAKLNIFKGENNYLAENRAVDGFKGWNLTLNSSKIGDS